MSMEPFNVAPLLDAQNRFRHEFSDFARLWQATKEDWRDDRSERFEREHLAPLGPSLTRFASSLGEFLEMLQKSQVEIADTDQDYRELY